MDKTKCTFWNLINDFIIEIPIIQRDYAQGRDSEKIKEIRNTLLDNLYEIIEKGEHLDFDFVYGSIKERNDRIFIPLDGQQRLTTLFLLHWYLATKENKKDDVKEMLKRFSYETRTSSREFCNELISNGIKILSDASDVDNNISDKIKDASWFFISWENDPTIQSMLVMLDAIHNKFKNSNGFFEKLLSEENPPITFQFLNMDNFGMEDSLYIKMNARGKALTDFENFKAKFEQLLQNKCGMDYAKEFANNIDGDWTDLFWNYREANNLFDNEFMNFFRAIAINNYVLKQNQSDSNLKLMIDKNLSFSKYEEIDCFDKETIEDIGNTLDILKNGSEKIKTYLSNNKLLDEERLFNKVIKDDLDYKDRVQFYAWTQYLTYHRNDFNIEDFINWIRIIINLSENTPYNTSGDYSRSIKSIVELLPFSNDILGYICDSENTVKGFLNMQIKEERIKATLILKDERWKEAIIKIENHGYFKGQIEFLLKFSEITEYYDKNNNLQWSKKEDNQYFDGFVNYSEKSSAIFDDKGLKWSKNNLYIWERALLCQGNYLLTRERNFSFLIDFDRDISWKKLLRDEGYKRDYVKKLLDLISLNKIEIDLQNIIDNFHINDWRFNFIKYSEMIGVCIRDKMIRMLNENEIYLLTTSTTAGYHREYYSYALKVKLASENNILYQQVTGMYYKKYISKINDKEIYIWYSYDNKKDQWNYSIETNWDAFLQEDNRGQTFDTEDEVIDFLKNNNYLNKSI